MIRRSDWLRRALVAISLVGWVTVASSQAPKAQGTVVAGSTKVAITTGMAVGYSAPNGQLVSVLLSDKPTNAKEFATDTRIGPGERYRAGIFEGAWKSQHAGKKFSGFMFTVGPKARLMTEEFLVGGQNNTFSIGNDEYIVELTSQTGRIAGRLRTKTPVVDLGAGRKAGLDATFDIPIAAPSK